MLLGHKAGDNTQVNALADALGWPVERKRLFYRPWELWTNRLAGTSLAGIDRAASSPLGPPWPELVITAGRRNEPVARWVRRQSPTTRLVAIGRPWAPLEAFDLIVTTPQYFLPQRPNILHNRLPLHALSAERLAAAASRWEPRLRHLPRPWTALLVGGDSGPYVFNAPKAATLGRQANAMTAARGGSLLISGSARTPNAAMDALLQEISVPVFHYRWQTSAAGDNPYVAFLALADRLVVTGESMSMLAEASATGKPLHIFDPGDAGRWWRHRHSYRYKPLSHHLAMRLAPRRMRRDVGNIQRALVAAGRAVWLGQPESDARRIHVGDDLQAAVARVRGLFDAA